MSFTCKCFFFFKSNNDNGRITVGFLALTCECLENVIEKTKPITQFFSVPDGSTPEVSTDAECRSRLRQEPAFYFRRKKLVKKTDTFPVSLFIVSSRSLCFSQMAFLRWKHCWTSVASMVAGVWTEVGFSNLKIFGAGSGLKNVKTGEESEPESVTTATPAFLE